MILSVLRFRLAPGRAMDLLDTFRRYEIFEKAGALDGCRDLYLASPDDEEDSAYVVGVWDDEAAYQSWLDHPERGDAVEDLTKLLATDDNLADPGRVWRVLHAKTDGAGPRN